MRGLWVGGNMMLRLGEESCFCTAGEVQRAEIETQK